MCHSSSRPRLKPAQGSAAFPDISLEAFVYGSTYPANEFEDTNFVFGVVDPGFGNFLFHNCTLTASGTNGRFVEIMSFCDSKNEGSFPLYGNTLTDLINRSPGSFSNTQPCQLPAISPVSMGILFWTAQGINDFTYFNAELQLSGIVRKGPPYPFSQDFATAEGQAVPEPPA